MALIPRSFLQTVVPLSVWTNNIVEIFNTGQLVKTGATGFYYAYPGQIETASEGQKYRLWLVTCAHVIEGARGLGHEAMQVRMNKLTGEGIEPFWVSLCGSEGVGWSFHPSEDVAVIPAAPEHLKSKGVGLKYFMSEQSAISRNGAVRVGLSEGDEVFILGFPVGWRRGRQDYPVVRHGVLAQIQGWLAGEHETFLVDGSGFAGNSGGPVVTKPHVATIKGSGFNGGSQLIGMVSKRKNYRVELKLPDDLKHWADSIKDLGLMESADLIEVVPVDAIDETIRMAMEAEEV